MDLNEKFLALRKKYIDSRFPKLNDQQREAVFHVEGPELIIAGAGSGKTTVITQRIVYMILFGNAYESTEVNGKVTEELVAELESLIQGNTTTPSSALINALRVHPVSPYNIMAITFTNKAANEMRERLEKLLGEFDARKILVSTFHSMCVGQLRNYGHLIGYPRSFTIYDDEDSKSVMKDLLREENKPAKDVDAQCVLDDISRWKDNMQTPDEAQQLATDFEEREHAKLYQKYQDRLFKVRAMDFDDLIFNMVRVLTECPKARRKLQSQFTYIMVDEYQDTSVAQALLVKLLVNDHTSNICAVGDDDQSIYSFRGAEVNNILNFPAIFKGCKKIRLEENYRSTGTILNAANSVIAHNTTRLGKTLWTCNADGDKVSCADYIDENEEARQTAKKVKQTIQSGVEPKDIAILFRSNKLTNAMEKALTREGIPYRVIGGTPLFARKSVKDIIAYLTLLVNPADDTRLNDDYAIYTGAASHFLIADQLEKYFATLYCNAWNLEVDLAYTNSQETMDEPNSACVLTPDINGVPGIGEPGGGTSIIVDNNTQEFSALQYAQPGDKLYITTVYGEFIYEVSSTMLGMTYNNGKSIVLENNQDLMDYCVSGAYNGIALCTAYPFDNSEPDSNYCFVVFAKLVDGTSMTL